MRAAGAAVDTVDEPARTTPVAAEVDVLVLGGGPAGIAAATAAARHGARTLLVERYGFLGGMGTAGGVTNFAGLWAVRDGTMQRVVRGTVVDDLLARIDALGGLNAPQDGLQGRIRVQSYDVPAYQCAADALLRDAGAAVLLHAWACGAVVAPGDGDPDSGSSGSSSSDGNGNGNGNAGRGSSVTRAGDKPSDSARDDTGRRVDALLVETKSGRLALRARQFVDASGDADLAHFCGVPCAYGDGAGDALYPSTMALIGGVDAARAQAAVGAFGAIDALMDAAAASGRWRFARRGAILRPQKDPTRWRANVTQLRNAAGRAVDATDAWQLSAAEGDGRAQVVEYLHFLRAEVPGFERAELLALPAQVGVRETRRLQAEYLLSGDDVLSGARFDDAIGLNGWPVEQHVAGEVRWAFPRDPAQAYCQLPWRMLVPPGWTNLLVAGRCAGMTHEGQSAARASGACFAMGHAAGIAAALRAAGSFSRAALQAALQGDGADLDR